MLLILTIEVQEKIDLLELQRPLTKTKLFLENFQNAQLEVEYDDPNCDSNYELIHAPERQI